MIIILKINFNLYILEKLKLYKLNNKIKKLNNYN